MLESLPLPDSLLTHRGIIARRLKFIINELKCEDPKYDQSVSLVLRALSNYASVGIDGQSFAIKVSNPRMSHAASELRKSLSDDKEWAANTINEHPYPLRFLWDSWLSNAHFVTSSKIWEDLVSFPMITITKEEDAKLRKLDKSLSATPEARYKAAGIVLVNSR